MKILYYSVHQILEDDEVRLLQSLGHEVCCLGSSSPSGASNSFRDAIPFNDGEVKLYEAFSEFGGHFQYGADPATHRIPADFIDLFDLTIVMHSFEFISHHWETLARRPVVWRTIGQGVEHYEPYMRNFRGKGIKIVRYSATEAEAPGHIGGDALIRFFKDPDIYTGWTGEDPRALTFSNAFRQRYPYEVPDFERVAANVPIALGGSGNGGLPNPIGMVPWREQVSLYQRSRTYLYNHGSDVPYTLNFIEAWMTGIPVVLHAPPDRKGPYFEIDRLITDGVDGYISRDVDTTILRLRALVNDRDLGARIGAAGRESAKRLFSINRARDQWIDFLASIGPIAA